MNHPRPRLIWDDFLPGRKGRGWLFVTVEGKRPWNAEYRQGIGWTEASAAGNYIDYGQDHWRDPDQREAQPGNILCLAYKPVTPHLCRYVETIEQAKAWIEEQVRLIRPELEAGKGAVA